MEAYDISNINGFETVGSMVVYEKGKPQRSDYRKFKLRTITGPDDYASMHEVLTRRFTHGQEERKILQKKGLDDQYGGFTKFPGYHPAQNVPVPYFVKNDDILWQTDVLHPVFL